MVLRLGQDPKHPPESFFYEAQVSRFGQDLKHAPESFFHHADANNKVSAAHVCRLWDYQSLLSHRAQRSAGTERLQLLEQCDDVKRDIAHYCGKAPRDFDELKQLMNKNR